MKRFVVGPIGSQARFVRIEIRNLGHGPDAVTVLDEITIQAEGE
jgi:hypothetical protein